MIRKRFLPGLKARGSSLVALNSTSAEKYWDARYAQSDRIWSGNPNTVLVRETTDLAPGRALDPGCGEGADAIWLAQRGWRVTATDISQIALDRAAEHAAAADVADRIDWQRHDLAVSFPTRSSARAVGATGQRRTPAHPDRPRRAAGHPHGQHPQSPTPD